MAPRGRRDGGWGKFDHDLKAPAVQGSGTCRKQPESCDSMTLPDNGVPRPETALVPEDDDTPEVLQREPLHFIVIVLLLADIIFGLGLAVFAEKVLSFRPMAIMGCGLAALGLGILAYFVLMGGGSKKTARWW